MNEDLLCNQLNNTMQLKQTAFAVYNISNTESYCELTGGPAGSPSVLIIIIASQPFPRLEVNSKKSKDFPIFSTKSKEKPIIHITKEVKNRGMIDSQIFNKIVLHS